MTKGSSGPRVLGQKGPHREAVPSSREPEDPRTPELLIDRVRKIALSLEASTEKISHGEPAFFVRGRMFAMIDNNHHASGHVAVWCNAPSGAQESLVDADPRHFFRPPYLGPSGWLGVCLDSGLDWNVIGDLVRQGHETSSLKVPKKRRTTAGRAPRPRRPRS
jgi:predicted DNA-binding protein (MmcQ/YjbR family)